MGHVYARTEGLVGVLISDKDYPMRPAYSLLTKILDEFLQRYPPSKFKSATTLDFPELYGVFPSSFRVFIVVFDAIPRSTTGGYDYESTS